MSRRGAAGESRPKPRARLPAACALELIIAAEKVDGGFWPLRLNGARPAKAPEGPRDTEWRLTRGERSAHHGDSVQRACVESCDAPETSRGRFRERSAGSRSDPGSTLAPAQHGDGWKRHPGDRWTLRQIVRGAPKAPPSARSARPRGCERPSQRKRSPLRGPRTHRGPARPRRAVIVRVHHGLESVARRPDLVMAASRVYGLAGQYCSLNRHPLVSSSKPEQEERRWRARRRHFPRGRGSPTT